MQRIRTPFRSYATKLIWLSHTDGICAGANKNTIQAAKSISSSLAEGVALFDSESSFSKFKDSDKDSFTRMLKKIHYSINKNYTNLMPEPISESLSSLIGRMGDVTHLIASNSSVTCSFLPRLAAMIDVAPITDVIEIESDNIFIRPIFAGIWKLFYHRKCPL